MSTPASRGFISLNFWRLPAAILQGHPLFIADFSLLFIVHFKFPVMYPIKTSTLHVLLYHSKSRVEICHRRIKISKKLLASRFIVFPHTKRVNVGCIMHVVLTEGFELILYEILLWNCCTIFWNIINFRKTLFGRFRYKTCEFASNNVT